jgi:lysophospholipase L1-like esterase
MGDWKGCRLNASEHPDEPIRLYNLKTDIAERHDIAKDYPKIVRRIVAFGDSTTAAHEAVEQVYLQRLAGALRARGSKATVINAGVAGNTTADACMRFQKDVLEHEPDIVIIQFGLNDSAIDLHEGRTEPRVSRQVYERNLAHFVKTLKRRGIRVILMTPNAMLWTAELKASCGRPPYDPADRWGFNALNAKYAESVRQVAKLHTVPLIDVYQLFRDYDGVGGQRADDLLLDGVHPNDKGHRLVADALTREVLAFSTR